MKPSFKTISAKISGMDTCGFFTGNGTFGLEKRDELKADIAAVEAQFDALAKVAKAAAELQAWLESSGSMMRVWPAGPEQFNLKNALAELSVVITQNHYAK